MPTLDAMAAAVPWVSLPVVAVLDARKGEVYASRYHWEDGAMRRDWDYAALTPEALALRLSEPTLLVGDGAAGIASPHARLSPPPRRLPSPACVGALGLARLQRGDSVSAAALTPLYLRPSEAELKRRAVAHA